MDIAVAAAHQAVAVREGLLTAKPSARGGEGLVGERGKGGEGKGGLLVVGVALQFG